MEEVVNILGGFDLPEDGVVLQGELDCQLHGVELEEVHRRLPNEVIDYVVGEKGPTHGNVLKVVAAA